MDRPNIEHLMGAGAPIVTPVIHVLDAEQALTNLDIVAAAQCPGAFLINHDFPRAQFLPILKEVRSARPDMWLGVNFLDEPGNIAFPVLGQLARDGYQIDAYWADDARIDERTDTQEEASEIARIRSQSGWKGLYFGGVSFKKQRPVPAAMNARAAELARPFVDVITTSGIATGHEADLTKIETFRGAMGQAPMALASGITPENAKHYCGLVDCFLVATGINHPNDFYNIDPARLNALLAVTRTYGENA
jgi:predicted TIM-barrel enzyme